MTTTPDNSLLKVFALTLGLAIVGGTAFWVVGMPIPWLSGSAVAVAIGAISRLKLGVPPLIRATSTTLYFDAWLRLWGDKGSAHWDTVGDLHSISLTKIPGTTPPGNPVPEPMTMSLLAAGLLGKAITRRRKSA